MAKKIILGATSTWWDELTGECFYPVCDVEPIVIIGGVRSRRWFLARFEPCVEMARRPMPVHALLEGNAGARILCALVV